MYLKLKLKSQNYKYMNPVECEDKLKFFSNNTNKPQLNTKYIYLVFGTFCLHVFDFQTTNQSISELYFSTSISYLSTSKNTVPVRYRYGTKKKNKKECVHYIPRILYPWSLPWYTSTRIPGTVAVVRGMYSYSYEVCRLFATI